MLAEYALILAMAEGHLRLHPTRRAALRRSLLAWYRANRRDLPWRRETPNPYHVLVSETMLQQTQVATVIAYFERFVAEFPTINHLAGAGEQDVLRLWQGLGYYRRARNLHAAAKEIVLRQGGNVPRELDALNALPGIGRYTAGAVASIAFGIAAPIVDGNVARVLSRWFAIDRPTDDKLVRDDLWRLAGELVPEGADAGDFNQAMMELGATVCTPRLPKCLTCPVSGLCKAKELGIAECLPAKRGRRKPTEVVYHVVAIECGGHYLYVQRPATGLWAGMWQFPLAENIKGRATVMVIRAWFETTFGGKCGTPRRIGELEHQTTHRTVHVTLWRAMVDKELVDGQWKTLAEAAGLPASRLQRRCEEMLTGQTRANAPQSLRKRSR